MKLNELFFEENILKNSLQESNLGLVTLTGPSIWSVSIINSIALKASLIDIHGHLCLPFPNRDIFKYFETFEITL